MTQYIQPYDEEQEDALIDAENRDDDGFSEYNDTQAISTHSNPYLIESSVSYMPLAQDSELRKPWREMNPYFAVEEAKLLPLPVSEYTMSAEGIAIEAQRRNIFPGTEEYAALEQNILRPFVQEDILFTRCPLCRRGSLKSRDGGRTCPCCRGFIMVPENSIMDFMADLNTVRESDRIDRQMKEIIKSGKNKRKGSVDQAKPKKLSKKEKDTRAKQRVENEGIFQ